MQPSEIADSYNTIAHLWLVPNLSTNGILQHERALRFRPKGGLALDVGCGCNVRLTRLLENHGYRVEGLDISSEMISLAKKHAPNATYYHADVCTWIPTKHYDFITAWDSIWHVPLQYSRDVLCKILGSLTSGGVIIWTTGGLDGPVEKRDSCMGPPMYYSVLGIPKTLQTIADAGCVCRHFEYDQFPEEHVYLIAQKV